MPFNETDCLPGKGICQVFCFLHWLSRTQDGIIGIVWRFVISEGRIIDNFIPHPAPLGSVRKDPAA
ncbi:hypothetical protein ES703_62402 [subsurface metagenome]